jgi:high-affinity K+ transport system ATPase subunit B
VLRESGGDRCAVTGGTLVLSDRIVVEITSSPGETFLDRMIALVEGASRQKTPNEIALDILIAGMTLILLVAVVTLQLMAVYDKAVQSTAVLVALFVCLAPTTIGGLLSAIGIAGMDRMVQRNVLAMSGRAVEAAGDCSTLLLDKTGTITYGNRMAARFIPVPGVTETELAEAALLSSVADDTPEGRSIVEFAEGRYPVVAPDTAENSQGRGGVGPPLGGRGRRRHPGRPHAHRDDGRHRGRHAARGGGGTAGPRRHLPQGHRQAGHDRPVRAAARDGHPHGDDHRGQPAHREGDRGRGGGR